MEYLVFFDARFRKSALAELSKISGKEVRSFGRFSLAEIPGAGRRVLAKAHRMTFVDALMPFICQSEYKSGDYSKIGEAIGPHLKKRFKIEALNLFSESEENAKSIEVKLGESLEKRGYKVDMEKPEEMVYVILHGKTAYVGTLPGQSAREIDAFRRNKFIEGKISRAEFKLKEAFEHFGTDPKKIKSVLDLGAAPGGWTNYMLKNGAKVVAVDNALLDYHKLANKNFVHIKRNAEDVDLAMLGEHGKFGALLIDMNINPKESARLAERYADSLKKGAALILTVKLVDFRIDGHIKEASDELAKSFKSIRLKKLPHNRMELTLFAVKR